MNIVAVHHKIAAPVLDYKQIKKEAQEMIELIDQGNFPGRWKEAFALSHAQVSDTPFDFFVLESKMGEFFGGNRIIANVKIVRRSEPVTFKEACMSYPFRPRKAVKRHEKVTITCDVFKKTFIPTSLRMISVTMELEGLEAFIVQHEVDHAQGISIYSKKSFK